MAEHRPERVVCLDNGFTGNDQLKANAVQLFKTKGVTSFKTCRSQFMPTISAFYGILIQMFWQDHAPPHFHALYGEFEALIDIRTLEMIRGSLPRRAHALVRAWATLHRNELMEDWQLCVTRPTRGKSCPWNSTKAPWRVMHVQALPGYRLAVRFVDGTAGEVDLSHLVTSEQAGVFSKATRSGTLCQSLAGLWGRNLAWRDRSGA